jgi:multiple sugar transport system substrate-binding protein
MACPHAFMNFLSIAGLAGVDIAGGPDALLPRGIALAALETLRELAALADPAAAGWSSIGALDAMAQPDGPVFCPMVFGFNSYARGPARGTAGGRRLRFGAVSLPVATGEAGGVGAGGTVAGGAGLALSARLADRPAERSAALAVLRHFASAAAQTAMACDGGQPARIEAWDDPAADATNGGFLTNCRDAMTRAHLRPRHAGYMALQNGAGDLLLAAAMDRSQPAAGVIDAIDALYRRTRAAGSVYGR